MKVEFIALRPEQVWRTWGARGTPRLLVSARRRRSGCPPAEPYPPPRSLEPAPAPTRAARNSRTAAFEFPQKSVNNVPGLKCKQPARPYRLSARQRALHLLSNRFAVEGFLGSATPGRFACANQ